MIKVAVYSTLIGATIMLEIKGSSDGAVHLLAGFFLVKVVIAAAKDRIARRHAR